MNTPDPDRLLEILSQARADAADSRLLARGMARAVIRRDGRVPDDGPNFGGALTADLLNFAFGVLAVALELRHVEGSRAVATEAFRDAGEALDAVVRNGAAAAEDDFYRVIASAAFHLGGYAARAYSSLPADLESANLTLAERILSLLIRRELLQLRGRCSDYLGRDGSRGAILKITASDDFEFGPFLRRTLTAHFCRAMVTFSRGLVNGSRELITGAVAMLDIELEIAEDVGLVPLWWSIRLARELIDELWSASLHECVPPVVPDAQDDNWAAMRRQYISNLLNRAHSEVELWPSQLATLGRVFGDDANLVVALPTGAGKTRIAELASLKCLARRRRVFYVTPLRALSSQVERGLRAAFDSMDLSISSLYSSIGAQAADLASLRDANVVVLTPEKLHFAMRMEPQLLDDVGLVVLDEGHMIGLGVRELRYEVLVQRLLRRHDADSRRLLCLSAALPSGDDLADFAAWIGAGANRPAVDIPWRPNQLRFGEVDWVSTGGMLKFYDAVETGGYFAPRFVQTIRVPTVAGRRLRPFPRTRRELTTAVAGRYVADGNLVLVFSPQQNWIDGIAEDAVTAVKAGAVHFPEPQAPRIARAVRIAREWFGDDHILIRALRHGIGIHHGELPMALREEIELLFRVGDVRLLISSPTLAQGLNITVAVVLFASPYRAGVPLPLGEFINVCGRAGRPYAAAEGHVLYCSYPDVPAAQRKRAMKAWQGLVAQVGSRHIRSGIIELVAGLIQMMARKRVESFPEMAEYILNLRDRNTKEDTRFADAFMAYEDALDEAILSLVGDSEADPDGLADAIDAMLEGSLWERELARMEADTQTRYRLFVADRGRYVWARTTQDQRRRFFLAGLAVRNGLALDSLLPELAEHYVNAEAAIDSADLAATVTHATLIARGLFSIETFRGDDELPTNWEELLARWLTGETVTDGGTTSEALGFVQSTCAYNLVWGVEAVRAFLASAQNMAPDEINPSKLSSILEVGVPYLTSAYLMRAGLDSRSAATSVVREHALHFGAPAELLAFLGLAPADLFRETTWDSQDAEDAWWSFYASLRQARRNLVDDLLTPKWSGDPPPDGAFVDALPAARRGNFAIYGDEPEVPIGEVSSETRARSAFRAIVFAGGIVPVSSTAV